MPSYGAVWQQRYAFAWDHTQIRPSKLSAFKAVAKRLVAAKARYRAVEAKTGVPWYMIAVIHEREASQNWHTQLAQGDPLNRKSTHVPKGEGPYASWEEGAIFALKRFKNVIDWRLEKILYHVEAYNGWGYYNHGVPSAYVWAGTTVYSSGKYVSDGVWSPTAVDQQLGCAGLIKCMMELDPSIQPQRETHGSKETEKKPPVGPIVVGGGAATVGLWSWFAAHPRLSILAALLVAGTVGYLVYHFSAHTSANNKENTDVGQDQNGVNTIPVDQSKVGQV